MEAIATSAHERWRCPGMGENEPCFYLPICLVPDWSTVGASGLPALSLGSDQLSMSVEVRSTILPLESRQSTTCSKPHAMGGEAMTWQVGPALTALVNARCAANEKASAFNFVYPLSHQYPVLQRVMSSRLLFDELVPSQYRGESTLKD